MNKPHVNALATALLCCLVVVLSVVTGVAQGTPTINRWVISGEGAPSSGGSVTLNDTLGQPIIGPSSGGNVSLRAGYWGGAVEEGPPPPSPIPVGGYIVPVSKLELLVPWMGLATLAGLLLTGIALALRKHTRR
jgi:hypothetical protein